MKRRQTKYKQGKFIPRNPSKYVGNPNDVIYRSSWEYEFMSQLDRNPQVLSWSSETTVIPYVSPVDGRAHRYFVDFKATMIDNQNKTTTYLIEIKPKVQTEAPKIRKATKKYINEVMTWGVNEAKWRAAKQYADARGYVFKVLTEYDLGIKTNG